MFSQPKRIMGKTTFCLDIFIQEISVSWWLEETIKQSQLSVNMLDRLFFIG